MTTEPRTYRAKDGAIITDYGTHTERRYSTVVERFENGLLHCADGPAIDYGNGSRAFYTHGRFVRMEWADGTVKVRDGV